MSDQILQQILNKLEGIEGDVRGVKTEMQGMKTEMQDMKSDIQGLKSEMQDMKSDMQGMKTELQRHGDHIHQLLQIVGATNVKLEATNEKLNQLADDVHWIKESQQTVLHIQQEQQKILERLSVRSISHEADIAELRRAK